MTNQQIDIDYRIILCKMLSLLFSISLLNSLLSVVLAVFTCSQLRHYRKEDNFF